MFEDNITLLFSIYIILNCKVYLIWILVGNLPLMNGHKYQEHSYYYGSRRQVDVRLSWCCCCCTDKVVLCVDSCMDGCVCVCLGRQKGRLLTLAFASLKSYQTYSMRCGFQESWWNLMCVFVLCMLLTSENLVWQREVCFSLTRALVASSLSSSHSYELYVRCSVCVCVLRVCFQILGNPSKRMWFSSDEKICVGRVVGTIWCVYPVASSFLISASVAPTKVTPRLRKLWFSVYSTLTYLLEIVFFFVSCSNVISHLID